MLEYKMTEEEKAIEDLDYLGPYTKFTRISKYKYILEDPYGATGKEMAIRMLKFILDFYENNSNEEIQEFYQDYLYRKEESKKRVPREGYIYFAEANGKMKIGRSIKPEDRIKDLSNANPDIKLVNQFHTFDAYGVELLVHQYFENRRIDREWFDINKDDIQTLYEEIDCTEGEIPSQIYNLI